MNRLLILLLLSILAGPGIWAQDAKSENDAVEPAGEEPAEPEEEVTDEEIDELLGLDEDYSEIEDDDFDFSEEVRFEQSTDFPVDI
ncbi:MAG: hypothetical protein OEY37_01950 [Gammaproteobacteria bacterium]|nr:hypothetical protein [Gammaproteobacteria bacterium]MDH5619870.1 hypothetical protein [Gammaproteobacteria bacterium]